MKQQDFKRMSYLLIFSNNHNYVVSECLSDGRSLIFDYLLFVIFELLWHHGTVA